MSDDALTAAIRAVLAASPFHGEGHRKVWARQRHCAIRTSLRRVLRLMRENDLLAPGRVGSPRGPRNHDGTIIAETVDTMWGTDLTTTFTGEGPAAVFVAVDHCSAECVGVHAHSRATRFEALEPIRQGVRRHFGGFAKGIAHGLSVRHDHGSQYMSDHFQKEIGFLGIESSPAFVRAPEGNGCAERFIRTPRKTCCGCATSRRSRNCARHCWRSAKSTTRRGSLNGTASSARPRSVRSNFNPSPGRRRVQSGVPQTAGGTRGYTVDTAALGNRR
jgi:transposase InsO family protein